MLRLAPLLALAACPKGRAPDVLEADAAALFAPGRYDYVELESHVGLPPMRNTVTETWTRAPDQAPPADLPGEVWLVENYGLPPLPPGTPADAAQPVLLGTTTYVMGERGLAHVAFRRGGDERTYAPKFALPAKVGPGVTWSGTHGAGMEQNTQSCAVEPTPFCAQGVAVACETRWPDRAVWLRHHWCVGTGWVGYEAVRVANGAAVVSWSEEVSKDGEPLPSVDIAQRPVPEVVVHKVPTGG